MSRAIFRFYAELNTFLPPPQRQRDVPFTLNGRTAVKHPIEALGVPHTEVELILVNGQPVDFGYLLQPDDRVAVYPVFHTLSVENLWRPPQGLQQFSAKAAQRPQGALRPPLPRPVRFLLDVHLGQLATYLRLLGFDAVYRNDFEDEALAALAAETGRVLLTRDRRLLMRKQITYGFCLHTRNPEKQVQAVLRRFELHDEIDPWQRCLRCNGVLEVVSKEAVLDQLEPKTRRYYNEFHRCQECGNVYWKGSHYPRMRQFIARMRENVGPDGDDDA